MSVYENEFILDDKFIFVHHFQSSGMTEESIYVTSVLYCVNVSVEFGRNVTELVLESYFTKYRLLEDSKIFDIVHTFNPNPYYSNP